MKNFSDLTLNIFRLNSDLRLEIVDYFTIKGYFLLILVSMGDYFCKNSLNHPLRQK